MKIKFPLFFILFGVFALFSFAQTVVIHPKKTVYRRKGADFTGEKRTFTITYPVVSGAIPAAAKKKLENTISYWRVFDTSLQENLTEYDWLSEAYYKVNYNKNGILDISLTQEGVGAYPDSQTVNLVIDLKTGEPVKFADVFKTASRDKFAAMVDKKLDAEKKEIAGTIRGDKENYPNEEDRKSLEESLSDLRFTPESFDEFSVGDRGITILYDAGFPHVIQALEPNGRYFFTWAEIKPFIKPDGLLGKFVR